MQCVLLICMIKDLVRTWYYVFSKHLLKYVIKVIWAWNFLFQKVLDYKFYFFNEYRNIHCIYYIINTCTLNWSLALYIYVHIYSLLLKVKHFIYFKEFINSSKRQIYENIVIHNIVVSRILRPPLALNCACLFIISSPVNMISIASMIMLQYTAKGFCR